MKTETLKPERDDQAAQQPDPQYTLAGSHEFKGQGLHTGAEVTLKVLPADADHGFVFVRSDLPGRPSVAARLDKVTATERGTVLTDGKAVVSTVEHLLAALSGVGVDNALIEVSGPEVPILDGSSLMVAEAVLEKGLVPQDAPRRVVKLDGPVAYESDGRRVLAEPHDKMVVEYRVDYGEPIGQQSFVTEINADNFMKDIAVARTFCQEKEVQAMRDAGMIKGGSLECAVVYNDKEVVNPPLRFDNEVVRHKLLDFVGDLALVGGRVNARFTIEKAGHYHHVEAMKALMNTVKTCCRIVFRWRWSIKWLNLKRASALWPSRM